MIDEKKIEEAARQHMIKEYCNNGDWSFPCKTADIKSQCEDDFKSGACWAMQEFLKDLWHPVSEEPDVRHKTIICLYKDGDISQDYEVYDEATTHDTSHWLGVTEFNWEEYAKEEEIDKWCYRSDLLPKQKGDKND